MPQNSTQLAQALKELDEVPAEAREEQLAPPTEAAMNAARGRLPKLHAASPCDYAVYPDNDGGVCIDARGTRSSIVVIWCLADGSIVCNTIIDYAPNSAKYGNAAELPNEFMAAAL